MRTVTGTNQQYRTSPMPRFIILSIAILLLFLPLCSPCSTMAFTVQEGPAVIQQGAPSQAPPKPAPVKTSQPPSPSAQAAPAKTSRPSSPSVQTEVVNVFVDRIEDGAIYSKDGRKFEIGSTRIIDNSRPATKMKAAELFFENGSLTAVILK